MFLAAAVAISGTVLPGISGSFLLLLLGQCEFVTGRVTGSTDGVATLLTGDTADGLPTDGAVLGVYGLGAAVGLLTTTRVVERALNWDPA